MSRINLFLAKNGGTEEFFDDDTYIESKKKT